MKNSRSSTQLLLFILVFALLAAIGSARQSTDPEVQLRAAIAKEEIAGNLYKQIISKSGKNRPLVAKALFRLGGCYEKQGNAEARRTYEQLIKDYSDQTDVISQARARISAAAPDNEMRIRQVWKVNAHMAEDWATPSPDGRNLAYLGTDNELIIRDLASGQDRMVSRLAEKRLDYFWGLRWSPDGKRIAYIFSEREIRIFDLAANTSHVAYTAEKPFDILGLGDWSQDGKLLPIVLLERDKESMGIVTAESGALRILREFDSDVKHIALSPKRDFIGSTCSTARSLESQINISMHSPETAGPSITPCLTIRKK